VFLLYALFGLGIWTMAFGLFGHPQAFWAGVLIAAVSVLAVIRADRE
jgi:hypothetical protein